MNLDETLAATIYWDRERELIQAVKRRTELLRRAMNRLSGTELLKEIREEPKDEEG